MTSDSPDGTRLASGVGRGYVVILEVLTPSDAAGNSLPVSALRLDERYGSGWEGRAVIAFSSRSPITGGAALGLAGGTGIKPGHGVAVHLALAGTGGDDPHRGLIVRSWPCIVSKLEPFTGLKSAGCHVGLIDPVTFLVRRPIWGAYRACSAGMMIGGALSSAAGGNAKPALQPILPGLPIVRIVEDYREDLEELPYAIAAGQPMREWLDAFTGLLGLRVEMRGVIEDASVEVKLSDRKPSGRPLCMTLGPSSTTSKNTGGSGPLLVTGYTARPGMNARGGVLDDPAHGEFTPFGRRGAIERIFSEPEVGLDEAARRLGFPLVGAFAEMLAADVISRQPGFRPGRTIRLSGGDIRGLDNWQLARVAHRVDAGRYENRATMIRGDVAWHPPPPPPRAPLFVSGTIDGGTGLLTHEPVPRDRLGRIPVTFPFVPIALGDEDSDEGVFEGDPKASAEFDTEVAQQRWPPRIPLTIIEPMAGSLHGFIPAHRHRDTCRVVVHDPFRAEIVGFQYRADRRINAGIAEATAGLVVEHDYSRSWSGWVFRSTDDLESAQDRQDS